MVPKLQGSQARLSHYIKEGVTGIKTHAQRQLILETVQNSPVMATRVRRWLRAQRHGQQVTPGVEHTRVWETKNTQFRVASAALNRLTNSENSPRRFWKLSTAARSWPDSSSGNHVSVEIRNWITNSPGLWGKAITCYKSASNSFPSRKCQLWWTLMWFTWRMLLANCGFHLI